MKRLLPLSVVCAALFAAAPACFAQETPPPVAPPVTPPVTAPETPPPPIEIAPVTAAPGSPFAAGLDAYKDGDIAKATTELEKAVAEEPENAEASAWLGFLYVKQNESERAIPYLEKAIQLKPTLVDPYTNLGNALLSKPNHSADETTRAIGLFQKASDLAPTSADAFFNLGFAYARTAQYGEAVSAYQKALELRPDDGKTYTNMGFALQKQNKNDEALAALRKGAELAPQDPGAWTLLGVMQAQANSNADAINSLETARNLDGGNYAVLATLGRLYAQSNRVADSAVAFGGAAERAEIRALPEAASLRYNEGVMLAKQNKYDEADAAYAKAIALNPRYYDAILNDGFVLYKQNKNDEAIERFRTAAQIKPKEAIAWINLASAYDRKKDPQSGLRMAQSRRPQPKQCRRQAVRRPNAFRFGQNQRSGAGLQRHRASAPAVRRCVE